MRQTEIARNPCPSCRLGVYCGAVHLFPFRTEKLSPPAQMVLLLRESMKEGPFFMPYVE